ncbi:MAG TPA: hypothetical protein DCG30_00930 [Ruminococcus sp.]|nr:hypothetical protein [Ruminococcus sp.]
MNQIFEEIYKMTDIHYEKFGYHPENAAKEINIAIVKSLCGQIEDDVLELKKLLEDSIRDNVDYLPERYKFDVKEAMGDANRILIN